ncbi:MAG: dTDP-4-dehydrorhamnose reductase [Treponema sp.]|nr:dTDP-4-dehydrorhamnose reductase [Treponema sp.]
MIWLIGNKGMLGSEVQKQLSEAKIPFLGTDCEVDITNPIALENFAASVETSSYFPSSLPRQERQISWIINCSAYTNVDKAESDVEKAELLNKTGACNIARIARKIGAKLIHISTDYVFDGSGNVPYLEDDEKNPTGVYGKTKSEGEDLIRKEMTQYYIIRTAWLYGFSGKNFVYTMTKLMNKNESLKVVNDQKGTPTFAGDLAETILKLIEKTESAKGLIGPNSIPAFGVYHYTNGGETTWYDFANEIYKIGKKNGKISNKCEITPCTSDEFPSPVKRPEYSVLSKEKITKALKIKLPTWQQSLEKFIKNKSFTPENF